MEVLYLICAIILITFLALKGVPIFYSAVLTSVFVLATANMDIMYGMTETYAHTFALYVKDNFFLFVLGAIFGKILEVSGAANAIADCMIQTLGEKAVIPSIILTGGMMSYGGISVFVGVFALYPLMFELFRKANIPKELAPGIYCAAAGSFSVWMPGSPSIQLLMPVQALGTSTFSAAIPGLIVAGIQMLLEIGICSWFVKRMQRQGRGWIQEEEKEETRSVCGMPFLLAILPMVVLISVLGVFRVHPVVALGGGILIALGVYRKYLPWKDGIWGPLQQGFSSGSAALMMTCSVVGFGGVVQSTPAFQSIMESVVEMNMNPLITSIIVTAALSGVSGSGPGGEAMALPLIKEYFIPMGVHLEALTSSMALSTMILTLPSNSVVSTAIIAARSTHRKSYPMIFITVCVASAVSMVLLLCLYAWMGYL